MVWNRVKAHPILRSSSILASTERDSFQSGWPRAPNALRMADSVMEENLALYTICTLEEAKAILGETIGELVA